MYVYNIENIYKLLMIYISQIMLLKNFYIFNLLLLEKTSKFSFLHNSFNLP